MVEEEGRRKEDGAARQLGKQIDKQLSKQRARPGSRSIRQSIIHLSASSSVNQSHWARPPLTAVFLLSETG